MKIEEGMLVRVKDDLIVGKQYGNSKNDLTVGFSYEMKKYKGMIKKVVSVGKNGIFNLEDCKSNFMIEKDKDEEEQDPLTRLMLRAEKAICKRDHLIPFHYVFTDEMVEPVSDNDYEVEEDSETVIDTKSPDFVKQLSEDITGIKYKDFIEKDGVCIKVTLTNHSIGSNKVETQVVLSKQKPAKNVYLIACALKSIAEITDGLLEKEDMDLDEDDEEFLEHVSQLIGMFKELGDNGDKSEIF